jgi:hypothetical protein
MPTRAEQNIVQLVSDRHSPDNSFVLESEEKRRRHVIGREIHTSFPLMKHLEVPTERHPFLVMVQELRDFRCGRAVSAHELLFLILSRQPKD